MDYGHLPTPDGAAIVQQFYGNSMVAGTQWITIRKPRGKSMLHLLMLGKGGRGGTGVVGANSVSAGGGGGGSGGQTRLIIPTYMLPDVMFLSLAGDSAVSAHASYLACALNPAAVSVPAANNIIAIANGGGNGGNAAAGTGGSAGAAGAIATLATMPLGFGFAQCLVGQAGIVGGAAIAGAALTLPLTGLLVTGGTGGAGLPAAAAAGLAGGAITGAGVFPTIAGGLGTATATVPPGFGLPGFSQINSLLYNMGGTGGGSTHGTATGAGLVQAMGGNGMPGCGGGGNGGALTGSTVAPDVGHGGVAWAHLVWF